MENTDISQVTVIVNGEPHVVEVDNRSTSGQIRNMGSGCQASEPGAETGNMAILGHSPFSIATHLWDIAVALTALGARVQVAGPDGGPRVEMPGLLRPE